MPERAWSSTRRVVELRDGPLGPAAAVDLALEAHRHPAARAWVLGAIELLRVGLDEVSLGAFRSLDPHTFLSETALRLWADYRRSAPRTSNRDRQAFLAGVMAGFEGKLAAQSQHFQEQGLVWVPGPELGAYFKRRYPRTQTVRRGGATRNAAYSRGQEAGGSIVLSKPVESQGNAARPKALRSGR